MKTLSLSEAKMKLSSLVNAVSATDLKPDSSVIE